MSDSYPRWPLPDPHTGWRLTRNSFFKIIGTLWCTNIFVALTHKGYCSACVLSLYCGVLAVITYFFLLLLRLEICYLLLYERYMLTNVLVFRKFWSACYVAQCNKFMSIFPLRSTPLDEVHNDSMNCHCDPKSFHLQFSFWVLNNCCPFLCS